MEIDLSPIRRDKSPYGLMLPYIRRGMGINIVTGL